MTDHLEQAAAKAVELADVMTGVHQGESFPGDRTIAAHLKYMAGLIRGGTTRRIEDLSVAVPVSPEEVPNVNTYAPRWAGERRSTPQGDVMTFYPSAGTSYDKVQADAEADKDAIENLHWRLEQTEKEYAQLRTAVIKAYGQLPTPGHDGLIKAAERLGAERGRGGEEIMRLQRRSNAQEAAHQRLNQEFQLAKLAHAAQLETATEKQRLLVDQRNDLLDAARVAVALPTRSRQREHLGHLENLDHLREVTERITRQCGPPAA